MRVISDRVIALGFVVLGGVYIAWFGFNPQAMGDYPSLFAPSMNALLHGDWGGFYANLSTTGAGGSVLLRAPAALAGELLVGGQLAIFRFGALFCLLALGGLGLMLAREMRAAGRTRVARVAVIVICVLTPMVLNAILFGHPEEALGAALCVGSVLLAGQDRPALAATALGLAIINKPWGVLALAPVLLAAPSRRLTIAAIAGGIVAAWTGSDVLASPAQFRRELQGASTVFVAHPVDLWWPLDRPRAVAGGASSYMPPAFLGQHGRQLAVLVAALHSLPLARCRQRSTEGCLALLALLFLTRCLLDPSNHVYYQLPLIIALTAWEARTRGAPVIALSALAAFWLTFHTIAGIGSLDAQFFAYMATAITLAAVLARPAFGIAPPARTSSERTSRLAGADPPAGYRLAS